MHFPVPARLDVWCAAHEVDEAVIGGFFLRDPYRPLGDLGSDGRSRPEDIAEPYGSRRGCVFVDDGDVRIATRRGPGRRPPATSSTPGRCSCATARSCSTRTTTARASRPAPASSTPTSPRVGTRAQRSGSPPPIVAVACDGRRSRVDNGLTLRELAEAMLELGVESAINLDGGGSTTLVHRRHLLNRPYSTQDQPAPESRPIVSALLLEPRV